MNAAGLIKVLAVGFADSGFSAMDTISLNVIVSATLDSIGVYPNQIYVPAGQSSAISIGGFFHDGVRRDLRFQTGVSAQSANVNIARIDQSSIVQGISEGNTVVNVSVQSRTTSIPIYVLAPDVWTTSIGNDDNNTGGAGEIPKEFSLSNNYPNPFNPTTSITFTLPARIQVTLKVYDILGRQVRDLVNEMMGSGAYTLRFDGSELASGMYFYRIQAGSFVQTKKLLLLR